MSDFLEKNKVSYLLNTNRLIRLVIGLFLPSVFTSLFIVFFPDFFIIDYLNYTVSDVRSFSSFFVFVWVIMTIIGIQSLIFSVIMELFILPNMKIFLVLLIGIAIGGVSGYMVINQGLIINGPKLGVFVGAAAALALKLYYEYTKKY